MSLAGEKRYGLASILSSRCTCGYEIIIQQSQRTPWIHTMGMQFRCCMGTDDYMGWPLSFAGNNECSWHPCYEQAMFSEYRK